MIALTILALAIVAVLAATLVVSVLRRRRRSAAYQARLRREYLHGADDILPLDLMPRGWYPQAIRSKRLRRKALAFWRRTGRAPSGREIRAMKASR